LDDLELLYVHIFGEFRWCTAVGIVLRFTRGRHFRRISVLV